MRILILALAINPGLPMYAVVMNHLCAEASIDFEESYHQSLQSTVISLKSEKAGLMQEHEKKLTQISNGGHGIEFFKKFKEDIRYDFKEVKLDIKGEYAHVRALIHNAGQDIVKNIFIFCTMVLFCMLIMPVGYALLIYTLYKRCGLSPVVNSMVNEVQNADAAAEKTIISESGSLSQRVTALFKKPQS